MRLFPKKPRTEGFIESSGTNNVIDTQKDITHKTTVATTAFIRFIAE
ncbi:MAG: hypothetical protein F6K24_02895 [Okeania sp. SIO2D1]|nr:hypothetical protein [Okeania sp. SIO2D1]